ncbi:nucleoside deaminase [Alishewanella sp. 16-MA]|uniref:Nucleoside deaminase n=1 Tax=Alishewanella maricola TaxID=2795740 RepID=A0ABS8C0F3_9ALTE|nr:MULTISPECIES: nucleoside deaminase [Gammaproteobacteria]MDP4945255.1 nucleoside deaminase [Alishewanella sp.]MCB5225615.1 nucleoside deaminase [Alishewanella maricola]MCC5451547.1 nucleoside deaminase [Rheinheimera sp. UJ51]MCF4008113.1 nucleoside deaminase [Rheinheimera sp. UJ63]MDP5036269.1 nucleoside deaminase [Alishewanella sp.]
MSLTQLTLTLPDWINEVVDWQQTYQNDQQKMALAIELSRQNVLRGTGGPFGSAIFDIESGKLLSVGVNRVMPLSNSTAHGEMMAIMLAEQSLQSFSLSADGVKRELFTSCEPCAMCLGGTLWSGVKRLVCAATADDARAIGFDEGPVYEQSYQYLTDVGIEVVRLVERDAAAAVLQHYLQEGGTIYNG